MRLQALGAARLTACVAVLSAGAARAQEPGSPQTPEGRSVGDPQALSVGVPVRIQDALTTAYGEAVLETISTSTYVGRHNNGLSSPFSETIKAGVAPGLGLNLGIANNFGDAGNAGYHPGFTVTPSFQYVLTQSHGDIPGLSVEGSYTPRPGTGLSGGTWGLSGQLTKFLGPSEQSPRLHLNFEYNKLNDETNQVRPTPVGYGIGLSTLLSDRTSLVGDVFYSQTAIRHDSQTFADLGVIYLIGSRLSLSAGGGVGLDRNTPAFRAFLSLSTSFRFLN